MSNEVTCRSRETSFSVIIPLECHRGQTERCLHEWLECQNYPRSLYELVVVAPDHTPKRELKNLESLLAGRGRLLVRPERHDLSLCVAGAEIAGGAILFFTESHCWPEPDLLEKIAAEFLAQPELAGLSCRSIPVTENRLSRAEAALYQADIEYGMRHPWRKILDQCFATRREAYFQAGGFQAEFGHFCEWLLAARFFHLGLKVDYAESPAIHHFYSGDLREWKVFTEDFADGEMRFHARQPRDPCEKLFPQVPEWVARGNWERESALRMLKVIWLDRRAAVEQGEKDWKAVFRDLAHWVPAAIAGAAPAWWMALLRGWFLRFRLQWLLRFGGDEKMNAALIEFCAALIRARRLHFLLGYNRGRGGNKSAPSFEETGEWEPGKSGFTHEAGFYLAEEWQGETFRWSAPVALAGLPLRSGATILRIELLGVRAPEALHCTRFYFNEERIPANRIEWEGLAIIIRLPEAGEGIHRLAWSSPRFAAAGNERALGLPLRRISWESKADCSPPLMNVVSR